MTVAAQLGRTLAAARRAGEPFEDAWPVAVEAAVDRAAGAERADWRIVLSATQDAWRAAWERSSQQTRAQRALVAVAVADRVPLASGE